MRKSVLVLSLFCFPALGSALELPKATCNESVFTPCICASKSPKDIVYRPRLKACGGRAAAILKGRFASSFSVVLRDRMNRDRYPSVGFNGCTQEEADLGLARCSAYKCQKVIKEPGSQTCCFGASGRSRLLSKASRLTIKLKDVPGSSADPLVRVCLPLFSPIYPMN